MLTIRRTLLIAAASLLAPMSAQAVESGAWEAVKTLFMGPATTDEFTWTGSLPAGQALEIKGVNGAIEVEPAHGDKIEIVAEKTGRSSDPAEVEIEIVEHDGGLTVCAVYPSPPGKSPNECRPGARGRMNVNNNDVEVEFRILLPANLDFVGRTVNGSIKADDLGGRTEAHTVNGSIKIHSRGSVSADTVNGSIVAAMGRADWDGEASFETVNGSITLELPADANVEVRGRTVNGGITTELPLQVSGKYGPKRLEGTLGSGARELDLGTVNGSIKIREAH